MENGPKFGQIKSKNIVNDRYKILKDKFYLT